MIVLKKKALNSRNDNTMNDKETNESVGAMDDSSINTRMRADYENDNKEGKTHTG